MQLLQGVQANFARSGRDKVQKSMKSIEIRNYPKTHEIHEVKNTVQKSIKFKKSKVDQKSMKSQNSKISQNILKNQ